MHRCFPGAHFSCDALERGFDHMLRSQASKETPMTCFTSVSCLNAFRFHSCHSSYDDELAIRCCIHHERLISFLPSKQIDWGDKAIMK